MRKTLLSALAGFMVLVGNTHAETLSQETAPDIVGKAVLGQALAKLDQGAPAGVDPSPTIHRNFTQIIDQNFASLNPSEAAQRVDGLSEAELSDLAQLYINAAADNGKPARLFNVLAHDSTLVGSKEYRVILDLQPPMQQYLPRVRKRSRPS